MNKLTFRVAVEEANSHYYYSIIPGMMVCGRGHSLEETLENTKSVIIDYMPDSATAFDSFSESKPHDYRSATWHIIEIMRY